MDPEAFETAWNLFLSRHHLPIRHLFVRLLSSRDLVFRVQDLEDYLQDFYCRLLSQGRGFAGRSDQELWAYFEAIAQRLIADRFRFAKRGKRRSKNREAGALETLEKIHCTYEDPEQIILRRERRHLLYRRYLERHVRGKRALLKRRVLLMALLEGRSSREIGARLDVRPGYVDLLVHRFRRSLEAEGLCLPRRRLLAVDRIEEHKLNEAGIQ